MNKLAVAPFLLCLVALGSAASPLRAADPPSEAQLRDFSKKLTLALTGGMEAQAASKMVLSLLSPGIGIKQEMTNDGNDAELLAMTVDKIPKLSTVFTQHGDYTFSDVYSKILNTGELKKINQPLSPAEKKSYDDAVKLLDPDQEPMKTYQKLVMKYAVAKDAQNAMLYEEKKSGPNPKRSQINARASQALAAMNKYKNTIDSAQQKIFQLDARGGGAYWTQLRARLEENKTNTGVYKTLFFPEVPDWKSSDSWTKYTFKTSDHVDESSYSKVTTQAKVSYGLFASGTASYSKEVADSMAKDNNSEISFELLRVQILRPWLDYSLLSDDNWKWDRKQPVSFGTVELNSDRANSPTECLMPLYYGTIFVVRKVALTAKFSEETKHAVATEMSASGGASYGPFSFGGDYNKVQKNSHNEARLTETGIEAPGMQIIAVAGTIPPLSPKSKK